MENGWAIEVQLLAKNFGSVQAVRDLSFQVRRGEIFSLLGPNGAGKSTTISMLAGLLKPDGGEAWVMGYSIKREPMAVKRVLGVVPQDIALYGDLTARENLVFWGKMYGLRGTRLNTRVEEVLEVIGLSGRQKERVERFSGGMKRRVNIGIALLHRPPVLILDEPTVGIDPQSRRYILDEVKHLNQQGITVLYTTHYMEEAQELSDHIAIMDAGQVIACGSHAELVKTIGELDRITLTLSVGPDGLVEAWSRMDGVRQVQANDGKLSLLAEDSNRVLPGLFESAASRQMRITTVEIQEANLEAVFLHLTGRGLRD